jgi:hypothetical protein
MFCEMNYIKNGNSFHDKINRDRYIQVKRL